MQRIQSRPSKSFSGPKLHLRFLNESPKINHPANNAPFWNPKPPEGQTWLLWLDVLRERLKKTPADKQNEMIKAEFISLPTERFDLELDPLVEIKEHVDLLIQRNPQEREPILKIYQLMTMRFQQLENKMEELKAENQKRKAENQELKAENQKREAENQKREAENQELKAENQERKAETQKLFSSLQYLSPIIYSAQRAEYLIWFRVNSEKHKQAYNIFRLENKLTKIPFIDWAKAQGSRFDSDVIQDLEAIRVCVKDRNKAIHQDTLTLRVLLDLAKQTTAVDLAQTPVLRKAFGARAEEEERKCIQVGEPISEELRLLRLRFPWVPTAQ